jgi:hypothetical protein
MSFAVGDSVAIIPVPDTGEVNAVLPTLIDFRVLSDTTNSLADHPESELTALLPGCTVRYRHTRAGGRVLEIVSFSYRRGVRRVHTVSYRLGTDGQNRGRIPPPHPRRR